MSVQRNINVHMRTILVDWLIEVAVEFHLSSETLFLTVSFMDHFLEVMQPQVLRKYLQLVGVAAMLIASKHTAGEGSGIVTVVSADTRTPTHPEPGSSPIPTVTQV